MSAVEDYLSAKAAFENFERNLWETAHLIQQVGIALKNQPGRMIFSNTSPGLPMEASMSRDSASFDGSQWKSAAQLQTMLADWHAKHNAMMNAWRSVPHDMQANLTPPDAPSRAQQSGRQSSWIDDRRGR